jgi:hypothetical protein
VGGRHGEEVYAAPEIIVSTFAVDMWLDHASPEGGVSDLYIHELSDACVQEARVVKREEICRVYTPNSTTIPAVEFLCVRHECSAAVGVRSEGEAVVKVPPVKTKAFRTLIAVCR